MIWVLGQWLTGALAVGQVRQGGVGWACPGCEFQLQERMSEGTRMRLFLAELEPWSSDGMTCHAVVITLLGTRAACPGVRC